MSYLEANLRVLEDRFPGISRDWRSQKPERSVSLTVEPSRAEGVLTARVENLRLYSAFDPRKDVQRSLGDIDPRADFAVIGGLGLGYHLELVVQNYPDLPVLVCDPDAPAVLAALDARPLGTLLANPLVSFFVGDDPRPVAGYLEAFVCRRIAYLPLRPLFEVHLTWFHDLEGTLNSFQAKSRVNDQTLARFYRLWLRNHTKNLSQIPFLQPVEALKGQAAGRPAVICAAGPSLETRLDWVRLHRDRVVLIVVDTAWNAVRLAGLVPDFLVFMDGQYWNSRHVDSEVPAPTRVVAELISHPRALRCAPGRTFISHSSVPFLKDWEERSLGPLGTLRSGGSVSTCAWELALHLGCDPVAFAGLDLGYPQYQTHVRGSQFEEALHRTSRRWTPAETLGFRLFSDPTLHPCPGVDGRPVLSDARMDLYRDWLERSLEDHRNVKVYNLSPGGSLIRGMENRCPRLDEEPATRVVSPIPASAQTAPPQVFLKFRQNHTAVPDPAFLQKGCLFMAQGLENQTWKTPGWQAQLSSYSLKAKELWGKSSWGILARQAENSFSRFPSDRSLKNLGEAWELARSIAACWQEMQKNENWDSRFGPGGR